MTQNIYGWCGKILKFDLTDSSISVLQTMNYADRFLGGRGIAIKFIGKKSDLIASRCI